MIYTRESQNVFEYAAKEESALKGVLSDYGYECISTYFSDFSVAEWCGGCDAVRDTYENAFNAWKNNIEWMTEIVMVLNHKMWERYEIFLHLGLGYSYELELSDTYKELWQNADRYVREHFKGDDLHYYLTTTD